MRLAYRLLYPFYRALFWARYAAPKRFTEAGLAVLVALVICALMVPDTENNLAYQGFALLFFLLLVALLFSLFFRAQFSVERVLPRFGTAGCPLRYKVSVKNLSRKSQADLVFLEELAEPQPAFHEWLAVQLAQEKRHRSFRFSGRQRTRPFKRAITKGCAVPPLSSNQQVQVEASFTPLRRGILRLRGVTLARPDPMGLVRAFVKMPLAQSVLVLPKRYALPAVALPGEMKYQQGGVALASSVGQSEEFISLRDYRHGDPVRHIHWRSWAKAGKPVVKEFEDEFFVRHALVLDTFCDAAGGEAFEEAVAIAASFACSIRTQESLLDLLFVGPESFSFTAGRGLGEADEMLQILASVRPCTEYPFRSLEHLVLNHVRALSGCICVFLGWDNERQDFIRKLQGLGLPALVLVVVEQAPTQGLDPGPMRDNPARFHVIEVGQVEQGLAKLS